MGAAVGAAMGGAVVRRSMTVLARMVFLVFLFFLFLITTANQIGSNSTSDSTESSVANLMPK